MKHLKKISKAVAATLALQGVCLAIGLWIQYRFVLRAAQSAADWEARGQLAEAGRMLLPELMKVSTGPSVTSQPSAQAALEQQIDRAIHMKAFPQDSGVVVVDDRWRVVAEGQVAESPRNGKPQGANWPRGEEVSWKEAAAGVPPTGATRQGWLVTAAGRLPAIAHFLGKGRGYAVVYRTTTVAGYDAEAILAALPPAGLLAFVWIGGLQGAVVCMMLVRMNRNQSDTQMKTDREALRRTQDLLRTREAVIFGLAKLAESRDRATGNHLERIALLSTRLAAAVRRNPKYRDVVTPSFIRLIGISSSLHDVGKVGIEDSILLKPGELTKEERRRMQDHPKIGADCLKLMERRLGGSNFLQMAREITLSHHERWDGSGYPAGLAGERIPLTARIVAIADVYDALSSRRVYKEPLDRQQCVDKIREEAGKHFDPDLVKAFLQIEPEFWRIAQQNVDTTPTEGAPRLDEAVHRDNEPTGRQGPDEGGETQQHAPTEETMDETVHRLESLLTQS